MRLLRRIFIVISFLFVLFLSNLINIVNPSGLLNSPDEVSNYLSMKEYVLRGKMYFEGQYLEYDKNNLLHQRGFLTWNNKLVPFNCFGFPIFYGPIYSVFLDNIKMILPFLHVTLLFTIIYKLYGLLYGEDKNLPSLIPFSFIFLTPLLYYLNFFYFNIIPNIIFFLFYLYYLLKFTHTWNKKNLYFAAFFASISVFFRYETIIFVVLVFVANILSNYQEYKRVNLKFVFFIPVVIIFFLFLGFPLLILNFKTYDSPFIYGYSLLNKIYFADSRTGSVFRFLRNIFFPSQVFKINVFLTNLNTVFFLLSPPFFIITFLALFHTNIKKIFLYFIIGIYFLMYNGMNPNTYLSGTGIVTSSLSVVRYWLLLLTLLFLPFLHYLLQARLPVKIKILLITFLTIHSLLFISVGDPFTSISRCKNYFRVVEKTREILKQIALPSDYLITSSNGKFYYDLVNIISWWGGTMPSESDKFFNAKNIAEITKFLISKNHAVYYLVDQYNSKYISLLEKEHLSLIPLEEWPELYKIEIQETEERF